MLRPTGSRLEWLGLVCLQGKIRTKTFVFAHDFSLIGQLVKETADLSVTLKQWVLKKEATLNFAHRTAVHFS